jgi:hypothetical protein
MFLAVLQAPEILAQDKDDRFQAGGHFGFLFDRDKMADRTRVLPEFGASLTYLLSRHLGFETESSFYPQQGFVRPLPGDSFMKQNILSSNYNGPAYMCLSGVKAGVRIGKVGIFAKARPGFAIFHPVYNCQPGAADYIQCTEVRKKEFAMDLGAVIEASVLRRTFVRLDAGDTYLRFGRTSMLFRGSGVPWINYPYGADHRHQFHLKTAIGFRF